MKPFKPDLYSKHAVHGIPDHEGENQEENVDTLIEHIETENKYGDVTVDPTDDSLVGFDPLSYAQRMRELPDDEDEDEDQEESDEEEEAEEDELSGD